MRGRRKRSVGRLGMAYPPNRPFTFQPMASLKEKFQWVNPGTHYPQERIDQIDSVAVEFGLTRNACLNLAWRVAFPILKSTLRSMKGAIRGAAESQLQFSAPPVAVGKAAKRERERQRKPRK